ncbi:hypothetical protein PR048_001633 [Dryococelus australis]|uniref:Uncharacterized protein n=1 Tax=Dryococelus australis TaxID=614101 RepID=A0ABQ9IJA4_9NEOP|nr:hypothetical protein PR048_001633 [Dryococelus australis]
MWGIVPGTLGITVRHLDHTTTIARYMLGDEIACMSAYACYSHCKVRRRKNTSMSLHTQKTCHCELASEDKLAWAYTPIKMSSRTGEVFLLDSPMLRMPTVKMLTPPPDCWLWKVLAYSQVSFHLMSQQGFEGRVSISPPARHGTSRALPYTVALHSTRTLSFAAISNTLVHHWSFSSKSLNALILARHLSHSSQSSTPPAGWDGEVSSGGPSIILSAAGCSDSWIRLGERQAVMSPPHKALNKNEAYFDMFCRRSEEVATALLFAILFLATISFPTAILSIILFPAAILSAILFQGSILSSILFQAAILFVILFPVTILSKILFPAAILSKILFLAAIWSTILFLATTFPNILFLAAILSAILFQAAIFWFVGCYSHFRLPPPPSGATVAERLAHSSATKANRVQSPAGHRIFASGNSTGRCRWSAGFLGDLSFTPPLHSGVAPYSLQSPSSALKTSLLRATQISSLTPPPPHPTNSRRSTSINGWNVWVVSKFLIRYVG